MAPPLGERPGSARMPGPQRSDRSLRRSAGDGLPQLATPSLASSASEAVDSATLAFLLSQSLAAKEQEEQVKREEEARKVHAEWRRRRRKFKDEFMALLGLSSRSPLQQKRMLELADMIDELESSAPGTSSTSSSARKKKKRRKRARTSSLPGTTSLCLHVAWGVLVLDSAGCYVSECSAMLGSTAYSCACVNLRFSRCSHLVADIISMYPCILQSLVRCCVLLRGHFVGVSER